MSQAKLMKILDPCGMTSVEGPLAGEEGSRRVLVFVVGEAEEALLDDGGELSVHMAECNAVVLIHQPEEGVSVTRMVWGGPGRENSSI